MKSILSILLVFFAFLSQAQNTKSTGSITFCNKVIEVPSGCKIESRTYVRCDDYALNWNYVDDWFLPQLKQETLKKLSKFKNFKKKEIKCYLLNKHVTGILISFTRDEKPLYQVLAYGKINGQTVALQFGSTKKIVNNGDLSVFAQEIIRIN
jgi:hypothetical protein